MLNPCHVFGLDPPPPAQAITDEFCYNASIIEARTFLPHLSLHICTIPRAALSQITASLAPLTTTGLPDITPAGVEPSRGGYVMLNIEGTPALMALHEVILNTAAQARDGMDGDPYGSRYIRDAFTPRIRGDATELRSRSPPISGPLTDGICAVTWWTTTARGAVPIGPPTR